MIKSLGIGLIFILMLTSCNSEVNRLYLENPANYSYIIGDVKNSDIDQQYHAELYITPASCQKTIIALLAYQILKPEYRYSTSLYISKSKEDLILTFFGDPTLTSHDLTYLLSSLSGTKFKNIILDSSCYKTSSYSPNISIHDIGTNSGRPVTAINIDENYISVKIAPSQIGMKATLQNDMDYTIDSDIITNNDPTSVSILWKKDIIKATGNININDSKEIKISPPDINSYIYKKINRLLSDLGITGKIIIGKDQSKIATNVKLIGSHQSKPLKEIIPPALKISDNLVFDSLYLTLITQSSLSSIEDWSQGTSIIKQLIAKHFGVNIHNAVIVDGSGMSRFNRIKTKSLFEILKAGYDVKGFIESLGIPGEIKSTLKGRINLPSSLRAKTGSLFGISCICGYNLNATHNKAFVLSSSNFDNSIVKIHTIEDNFINKVFNN